MPGLVAPVLDAPALRRYGLPEYVKGAQPAAASDFVQTIDSGYFARLITLRCTLAASAVAANRRLILEYRDAEGVAFWHEGTGVASVANSTTVVVWDAFCAFAQQVSDDLYVARLAPLVLYPTYTFRIRVEGVQAGDQLSTVRFLWERFYPGDAPGRPE